MSDAVDQIREARPRRFRPYPEYKDSGVEWLGQIPAHWEGERFWRVCKAMSGGTPAKDNQDYWNGNIPWVSPKDMKRREIDASEDSINEQGLVATGLKLIPPPVVLVVVRGMILARSFPVGISTVPVTINQDMKALRLFDGVEPFYFAWALEGLAQGVVATVVEEAAHGTRAIRMDQLRNLVVPVPSRAEQRAIATFLDRETAKIDELVARKQRLIELLQEKRNALITSAVTRGVDQDVPLKESGVEWLGDIPAHWEVKRIRDVAESLQTGPFGSQLHADDYIKDGVPVINPANLVDGRLVSDPDCTVDEPTAARLERHRLLPGDILFARRGELGRCGLVSEDQADWLCGTGCLRLRSDRRLAKSAFLMYLLSISAVRTWLQLQSVGSTMENLNTSIIGRLPLCLPSLEEQEGIVSHVDIEVARLDRLVSAVRRGNQALQEFRTSLISAAVTGQIDVREG